MNRFSASVNDPLFITTVGVATLAAIAFGSADKTVPLALLFLACYVLAAIYQFGYRRGAQSKQSGVPAGDYVMSGEPLRFPERAGQ